MIMNNPPPNKCPRCGLQVDSVAPLHPQAKLMRGAFSVCSGCGAILVFDQDLVLRYLTPAEMIDLKSCPAAWRIITLAQEGVVTRN